MINDDDNRAADDIIAVNRDSSRSVFCLIIIYLVSNGKRPVLIRYYFPILHIFFFNSFVYKEYHGTVSGRLCNVYIAPIVWSVYA